MNILRRAKETSIDFLKKGLTPHDLALTMAFGITLGMFPVLGVTSILCTAASLILGLNMVALQSVNWAMAPVQLLFIIPFTQIGGSLFGQPGITLNVFELKTLLESDFSGTMMRFMNALLSGVGFWAIIALPLGIVIYIVSHAVFSRLAPASAKSVNSRETQGDEATLNEESEQGIA
jgi:uncharacterized protein (DUF2062 family)